MNRQAAWLVLCAVVGAALLGGCRSDTTTLTVLAASSLRDVFPRLAGEFEAQHAGVTVAFSFGASGTLAAQVKAGAPADVLATASRSTMLAAGSTVGDASVFATNLLAVAVAPTAKAKVRQLDDLADPDVRVALCQKDVPCGTTAQEMLAKAGLEVTPATYTADVAAVLTTVESGEVDAGVVYRTDALAAGAKVESVAIPPVSNVSTAYAVALVEASDHRNLGADFIALVKSTDGRQALTAAGFEAP